MTDDEFHELWREIRILQIQVAMITAHLTVRTPKGSRKDGVRLLTNRELLEKFERIDAKYAAEKDEG